MGTTNNKNAIIINKLQNSADINANNRIVNLTYLTVYYLNKLPIVAFYHRVSNKQ